MLNHSNNWITILRIAHYRSTQSLAYIILNIQTRIEAIEQNAALHEAAQFHQRADVLDELEQILQALAMLAAAHPNDAHTAALHARALVLQHTLAIKNAQFFDHLRTRIATGSDDPAALLHMFLDHHALSHHDDLQYDSLDVLVSGLLHTDESPQPETALEADMVGYQPTPARLIVELVQRAQLDPADVFVDLGAGLGHVAIVVALLSGARTVGIEIDAGYCAYAQRCAAMLHLDRAAFRNEDARTADVSDGTVFFLYTPFRGQLLQTVLDRLQHEAEQRPIRVCTYGSCTTMVAQQPWLTRITDDPFPHSPLVLFQSSAILQPSTDNGGVSWQQ